eukprot:TRINITY_DN3920_c0_g1_i1.p1 TRINITY_DN3920_c0_g1~~TRINITY_DN3920_c0_g1_i1.p1  ORF type:complete len:120 (-),score=18.91 TRINITY_DN3920_c0_g1_i1:642-1001(-)
MDEVDDGCSKILATKTKRRRTTTMSRTILKVLSMEADKIDAAFAKAGKAMLKTLEPEYKDRPARHVRRRRQEFMTKIRLPNRIWMKWMTGAVRFLRLRQREATNLKAATKPRSPTDQQQ